MVSWFVKWTEFANLFCLSCDKFSWEVHFYWLFAIMKSYVKVNFKGRNDNNNDKMISICTLKFCDESICKSLYMIFKSCLTQGILLSQWKKTNIVPLHKKKSKQCLKTVYKQFPDRIIPQQKVPPTGHFPARLFPQWYISFIGRCPDYMF